MWTLLVCVCECSRVCTHLVQEIRNSWKISEHWDNKSPLLKHVAWLDSVWEWECNVCVCVSMWVCVAYAEHRRPTESSTLHSHLKRNMQKCNIYLFVSYLHFYHIILQIEDLKKHTHPTHIPRHNAYIYASECTNNYYYFRSKRAYLCVHKYLPTIYCRDERFPHK